jgi:hypothetical protein
MPIPLEVYNFFHPYFCNFICYLLDLYLLDFVVHPSEHNTNLNFPSMLGSFASMLGKFASMLGKFASMLGSFQSMLAKFASMLGDFPSMLGSFQSMLAKFGIRIPKPYILQRIFVSFDLSFYCFSGDKSTKRFLIDKICAKKGCLRQPFS